MIAISTIDIVVPAERLVKLLAKGETQLGLRLRF